MSSRIVGSRWMLALGGLALLPAIGLLDRSWEGFAQGW